MEKINVAELLRNCPRDMKLDCTMYEDVYFDYVDELNIIHCYIKNEGFKTSITFNQYGTPNSDIKSKCVIFPKGKTTWKGFHEQFKDGDILYLKTVYEYECVFINKIVKELPSVDPKYYKYANFNADSSLIVDDSPITYKTNVKEIRLATEEEKQKLFDSIKYNGYKWNAETKTLDKLPRFKVGDRVKHISTYTSGIIVKVNDKGYHINYPKGEGVGYISFTLEKDYELVPNKFDINTLVPFESRVLVRDTEGEKWKPAIWGYYDVDHIEGYPYETVGGNCFCFCIPYECNKHLLGKIDDCNNYYKTW